MAISSQGWAFVSGSGTGGGGSTSPGGNDTNIQFNNNGSFSGSNALVTDGSGSLSASVHISASAFYGDGSNLTGLTASAVNVADGPEQAVQFRVDTPSTGEISGSAALMFMTASSTLSLSSSLAISGTAGGYQSSELYFGTSANPIGRLNVEEDAGYIVTLAANGGLDLSGSDGVTAIIADGTDFVVASAYTTTALKLTDMGGNASVDIGHDGAISGSNSLQAGTDLTVGGNSTLNGNLTIGNASNDGITLNAGSISQTSNQLTWKVISGSAATGSGPTQNGAILFFSSGSEGTRDLLKFHTSGTAPGTVFPQSVYLTQAGALSGTLAGPGSYLGIDKDNKIVVSAGDGTTAVPGGSDTNVQFNQNGSLAGTPGLVFNGSGSLILSGTNSGAQASELILGTAGQKLGRLTVDEDGGYAMTVAALGALDLSASDGITAIIAESANFTVASAYTTTGLRLTDMGGNASIDIGHDGAISGSNNLQAGANLTVGGNATLNGNVTLGDLSGDGITIKAGSITQTDNPLTYLLKDSADGLSGNGALMFFTGSGGDFLKFHTAGSAKGIISAQQTYLSKGGSLSGAVAGPGSYLALDSSNKIVITSSAGGSSAPGGSNTQIQFNDGGNLGGDADFTWNKTTNALTIAGSTATSASSNQGVYFRAEGPDPTAGRLLDEPQLVVSGSMVGIGTATPSNSPSVDTFLDVRGHMRVGRSGTGYIFSNNDDNTYIKFGGSGVPGGDGVSIFAGAKRMLVVDENASTADAVIIGSASLETDFAVLTAMSTPNGDSMSTAPAFYVSGGADSVGVGTSSPLVSMDIHYTGSGDPVKLSNDTGGGHVAYFGTSSANLTAGGVYYLNSNGGWESVDSATTGSGHNQLLGIALGTKAASSGMLLNGYFDVNSFYSGSFIKGGPVYIQSSSVTRPVVGGGYLSSSAPTAGNSYVRVVGYGTDTPNVIYFNPDSTYVEIG